MTSLLRSAPLEPLVTNNDEGNAALYRAAEGTRPHFNDSSELQLIDDRYLQLAAMSTSYCVSRDGTGTHMTISGNTPNGESAAVLVTECWPFLILKRTPGLDVERLLQELDASLIATVALDKHRAWAPEYRAFRDAIAGCIRPSRDRKHIYLFRPDDGPRAAAKHAVVGHKFISGTLLRGSGAKRGYNGLEIEEFVIVYFYFPELVARAKRFLHGMYARHGAEEQVNKLGAVRQSKQEREAQEKKEQADQALAAKNSERDAANQSTLDTWIPHGDTEGDIDMETGEERSKMPFDDMLAAFENMRGDDQDSELLEHQVIDDNDDGYRNTGGAEPMSLSSSMNEGFAQLSLSSSFGSGGTSALLKQEVNSKEGKTALTEYTDELFARLARERLLNLRGRGRNSILNSLNEDSPLIVGEASIDYVIRVSIECGFRYNEFIEVDMQHTIRPDPETGIWPGPGPGQGLPSSHQRPRRVTGEERTTTMQIEVHCDYRAVRVSPNAELQRTLPQRVLLALDCEMETAPDGSFPKPERERVLQIGCAIPMPNGKRREIGFAIGQVTAGPGSWHFVDEDTQQQQHESDDDDDDGEPSVVIHKRKRDQVEEPAPLRPMVWRRELDKDVDSEFIFCFEDEASMLLGFATFVRRLAPDVVMTYNGDNFDMPYLLERSKQLDIEEYFKSSWGRGLQQPKLIISERVFASTAHGKHTYKDVRASHVLFFDLFQYLKRNPMIRLRSYSLNSVAMEYIGMEKEDVAYSTINTLQQTPDGRRKLLTYCIRDAVLPMLIDNKLTVSEELTEKSRGTGVPVDMLLKRGMQVQCKSFLYRRSALTRVTQADGSTEITGGMLIPQLAAGLPGVPDAGQRRLCVWYTRTDAERAREAHGDKYEGATVISPKRGLHDEPIGTLDFMSLYPSIMASGNYCPSTLLAPHFDIRRDAFCCRLVESGQCTWDEICMPVKTMKCESPFEEYENEKDASRFLYHHALTGLVPEIDKWLLEWRASVKQELKRAKETSDKERKSLAAAKARLEALPGDADLEAQVRHWSQVVIVLDKRQLSVKLIANSLYGYFGARSSDAYCVEIADAVTRRGRAVINYSKDIIVRTIAPMHANSPAALEVAKYPGVKHALFSIRPGREVVDELCSLLAQARLSVPKKQQARIAPTSTAAVPIVASNTNNGKAKRAPSVLDAFFMATAPPPVPVEATVVQQHQQNIDVDEPLPISIAYGDTDSLFVKFWIELDFTLAAKLLIAMAEFVSIMMHQRWPTRNLHNCIYRFEFEKIFKALLILAKKKYAGVKWLWKGGKLVPADPDDEFEPAVSGLETARRDTTRLVSEKMMPVLRILLNPREARKQKLERARAFIYMTMVEPLQKQTVSIRDLSRTCQLRKLAADYTNPNALPIHVQTADRLTKRGDVKRPGDRIAFVVVGGLRSEKTASRGECPVYALENNIPIDANYYLDRHVAPAMCRLFEPIIIPDDEPMPGKTEAARQSERVEQTREFIFGSRKEYYKPANVADYYDSRKLYEKEPFALGPRGRVRYKTRHVDEHQALLVQHTGVGANCKFCRKWFNGEAPGYVCYECFAADRDGRAKAEGNALWRQTRIDFEDLNSEWGNVFNHCQRCAKTERNPTTEIMCRDTDCDTFWHRKECEKAVKEVWRRYRSTNNATANHMH